MSKPRQHPTAEQQRTQSAKNRARVEQRHANCEMTVRPQGPHMGLYCAQHGTWIQWLPRELASRI